VKAPGFGDDVRKAFEAPLLRMVVASAFVFNVLLVASEWHRSFWAMVAAVLGYQGVSAVAGTLTTGARARWVRNLAFCLVNTFMVLVVGQISGWSLPALMMVPYVVAQYGLLGEGKRPFIVAQLAVFTGAMALGGVPWASIGAAVVVAWTVHWLSDTRARELREAVEGQLKAERELRQAQKLESVGRLAAGVAHELNTPVQYASDSVAFIGSGVAELDRALQAAKPPSAEPDADLEYLREKLPAAIGRARDGLQRIAGIVRSMRELAHPESHELTPVDVNRGIESALVIAGNECRYVAEVVTRLEPLPPVLGHAGELNQVVLNVIVNAAHAIGERVGTSGERGRITVTSRLDGADVAVSIADTGGGIPASIRDRIFEPFFTTKEVGRGTGQGLAIARAVVKKHGGTLTFETREGQGTTFYIRLPAHVAAAREAA